MSKAQYAFYMEFCSKDKNLLQCTRKLIGMFSCRKTAEEKVVFVKRIKVVHVLVCHPLVIKTAAY